MSDRKPLRFNGKFDKLIRITECEDIIGTKSAKPESAAFCVEYGWMIDEYINFEESTYVLPTLYIYTKDLAKGSNR